MKIRLIGGGADALEYNGIRDQEKLKTFILADILTYQLYRIASNRFHFKGDDESQRKKYLDMVVSMSKSLSLDFYGSNSGTPADQISKRIQNIVDALNGDTQKNSSPSVLLTDEQMSFYSDSHKDGSSQISVKLLPPLNNEPFMMTGHSTSRSHVPLSDIVKWISDDMLTASRGEIQVQCVLRNQYEVLFRTLGGLKGIPDDVALDAVRIYLSLKSVFHLPLQNVGEIYEPAMNIESFRELLSPMPPRISMEKPIALVIGDVENHQKLPSDLESVFPGIPHFISSTDELGIGTALYKSRLSSGYGGCTLIAVMDKNTVDYAIPIIQSEIDKMNWTSARLIGICTTRPLDGIHSTGNVNIIGADSDLVKRLEVLKNTGIDPNDIRLTSLLKGPYYDVLCKGYPSLTNQQDHLLSCSSNNQLIDEYITSTKNDPDVDSRFRPLVLCVKDIITDLGSTL